MCENKQIHQHDLPSLELEISLKLMELFRMSTRNVPEDQGHRQAPERILETYHKRSRKSVREASHGVGISKLSVQRLLKCC